MNSAGRAILQQEREIKAWGFCFSPISFARPVSLALSVIGKWRPAHN